MITIQEKRELTKIGEFNEQEFTVKATPKAFKILIGNLYSDRIAACCRELICNASEANMDNGKADVPVSVWLPSTFEPTFKVKDVGQAMSHNFMLGDYSKAFASTKDKDNNHVGSFGIGRMVALSICDQYIIINCQNGVKRTYSVFYNEQEIPTIAFLGEEITTESDGCCVEIPCNPNDSSHFESKAKEAFRYYKVKPKIENRDNFTYPINKYIVESSKGDWALQGSAFTPKAIMGHYSYNIDVNAITGLDEVSMKILQSGAILYFNIGDLAVQANREGLFYDKRTIQNLKEKLTSILPEVEPIITKHFIGKNIFEQLELNYSLFQHDGQLANISGLVKSITSNLKIPSHLDVNDFEVTIFSYDNYRNKLRTSVTTQFHYQSNAEYFYADKKTYLKQRAKKFLAESGNEHKKIIFFYPKDDKSVDNFKTKYNFDVSTFNKASTLPFDKQVKGIGHKIKILAFNYHRRDMKRSWTEKELDPKDDIVYVLRKGYNIEGDATIGWDLRRFDHTVSKLRELTGNDNLVVYGLTKRQIAQKQSHWKDVTDYYNEELKNWEKKQEENIEVFNYHGKHYESFPKTILDKLEIDKSTLCGKILEEYNEVKKKVEKINVDLITAKNHGRISTKYKYSSKLIAENYPIVYNFGNPYRIEKELKKDLSDYVNTKKT